MCYDLAAVLVVVPCSRLKRGLILCKGPFVAFPTILLFQ